MKCFFDENEARGTCRFCGRAVCKEHAEKRMPYIATIYVGAAILLRRLSSRTRYVRRVQTGSRAGTDAGDFLI